MTRIYCPASGWAEGLPVQTEDYDTESSSLVKKRWSWSSYTQDNTSLSYILNPRVTETQVGDGTNTKRTTIDYYTSGGAHPYGLPEYVKVYDSDLSTVLKQSYTEYNLSSTYTDRRIIGLPSKVEISGREPSSLNLMSKVTYAYDEGSLTGTDPVQNISPTQHDNTNYSSSFVTGRGLLTSTTRWDATDPAASGSAVTWSFKYNTAGSPVSRTDPLSHTIKIAYADNFNSSPSVSTYAYPTTLTDPAGNSSTIKYRYDIGADVETASPAPAGQTYGKTSKHVFDSVGRLERQSIYVNATEKAYQRYEYPTNGIETKRYDTVVDTDADGADTDDEVLTESWFDGAGRARRSRTEHPGTTGGWTATQAYYDILGRVAGKSVPTEVSVSGDTWTPAGDDSSRGWIWNTQEYDWKGRVTRTIPSDSTGSDGKDTLITYEGCGCAGGQVTTAKGPVTTAVDVSGTTQTTKRRTQKSYEDILGRTYKTEVWDLDGGGSTPYSTTRTTFNGRDQATLIRAYSGSDSSSTYQDTTALFDGHGRLTAQHLPVQATNRATNYAYFADDRVETVTDARGASTNYTYNSRGLIDGVSYSLPTDVEGQTPWIHQTDKSGSAALTIKGGGFASNVEVTLIGWTSGSGFFEMETFSGGSLSRGTSGSYQTLAFTVSNSDAIYDLNHNVMVYVQVKNSDTGQKSRTENLYYNGWSTAPGYGTSDAPAAKPSVAFEYDSVGNRTAITDGMGSVAYAYDSLSQVTSETRTFTDITSRTYETDYTYTLGGQLKTITDPFGAVVSYSYQKSGRLSSVSGTGYDWSNPFVSDMKYRAWGAISHADYGNGSELNLTYDNALRPTRFAVKQSTYTRGSDFTYNGDGWLNLASDLGNHVFDKSYKYDHAGRLSEALSGFEARGETSTDTYPNRPYKQTYTYDAFDNRTGGDQKFWRTDYYVGGKTYVNNRLSNGWPQEVLYDADGRPPGNTTDAAGKPVEYLSPDIVGGYTTYARQPALEIRQKFDADGEIGKREEVDRIDQVDGEDMSVVESTIVTYYIRSAVLGGQVIDEIKPNGTKQQGNVYANGVLLAEHRPGSVCSNCLQNTKVIEMNPMTGSSHKTDGYASAFREERDPLGATTGIEDPWASVLTPTYKDIPQTEQPYIEGGGSDPFNPTSGCEKDGMPYDCNSLQREAENGSVVAAEFHGGKFYDQYTLNSYVRGALLWVFLPGDNNAPAPPGGTSDAYGSLDRWETFYFSDFGGSRTQTRHGPSPQSYDDDCQKFARMTEAIAKSATTVGIFMQAMINTFIGPNLNVNDVNDLIRSNRVGDPTAFGDSGFKTEFQDSSNQVRHFTGGLWAGYLMGAFGGRIGMNSNERNSVESSTSNPGMVRRAGDGVLATLFPTTGKNGSAEDVALNAVSTSLGSNLVPHPEQVVDKGDRGERRRIPEQLGYSGLANEILKQVCN